MWVLPKNVKKYPWIYVEELESISSKAKTERQEKDLDSPNIKSWEKSAIIALLCRKMNSKDSKENLGIFSQPHGSCGSSASPGRR